MKRAQSVVEYVLLSVLLIIVAAAVIGAFHLSNFSSNAVFGIKTGGYSVTIPPMTP